MTRAAFWSGYSILRYGSTSIWSSRGIYGNGLKNGASSVVVWFLPVWFLLIRNCLVLALLHLRQRTRRQATKQRTVE